MNRTASISLKSQNDCDPVAQLARQVHLDELYALDGRHFIDHEMHGLYTGLWIKYASTPPTDEASQE